MKNARIVFMGTPVFGREILKCLVESGYQVVAAVTQPDKLVGRKQKLTYSPVKEYALSQGIEVIQPIRIRKDYQGVLDAHPDLIVTCAYGQIIPKVLLDAPSLGCVNVHASLLPKLRGGAPIQHAIIDGYQQTGVTIMEMAVRMDAGDMIAQAACTITDEDTYRSLHDKLIELGKTLLIDTMPAILAHSYEALPQDPDEVTFGYNIEKEEEHIDFTKSYREVYNQMRGLIDEPCSYGIIDGKKLKFVEVALSDQHADYENGTLLFVGKGLGIVVDKQIILLNKVQLEGKNAMSSRDFRNGAGRNFNELICQ